MSRRRAVMPAVEDVHGADLSVVDVVTDDAPGVPPVPAGRLDEAHAKALTERIRLTASTIRERWDRLVQLVEQAKAGEVADVLGYASWTAYLSDVLGGQMRLAGPERAEWVGYLTGQGMSTRAIAPIVGASPKTVARDAERAREASETPAPVVTGRDGKTYTPPKVWAKCSTCGWKTTDPDEMPAHRETHRAAARRVLAEAEQPTIPGTDPERMVPTLQGLGVSLRGPIALDDLVTLPDVDASFEPVLRWARDHFVEAVERERVGASWVSTSDVPKTVTLEAITAVEDLAAHQAVHWLHRSTLSDTYGSERDHERAVLWSDVWDRCRQRRLTLAYQAS